MTQAAYDGQAKSHSADFDFESDDEEKVNEEAAAVSNERCFIGWEGGNESGRIPEG